MSTKDQRRRAIACTASGGKYWWFAMVEESKPGRWTVSRAPLFDNKEKRGRGEWGRGEGGETGN
jgi:hypothetical protein